MRYILALLLASLALSALADDANPPLRAAPALANGNNASAGVAGTTQQLPQNTRLSPVLVLPPESAQGHTLVVPMKKSAITSKPMNGKLETTPPGE